MPEVAAKGVFCWSIRPLLINTGASPRRQHAEMRQLQRNRCGAKEGLSTISRSKLVAGRSSLRR